MVKLLEGNVNPIDKICPKEPIAATVVIGRIDSAAHLLNRDEQVKTLKSLQKPGFLGFGGSPAQIRGTQENFASQPSLHHAAY